VTTKTNKQTYFIDPIIENIKLPKEKEGDYHRCTVRDIVREAKHAGKCEDKMWKQERNHAMKEGKME
jgi:hypothetical protein